MQKEVLDEDNLVKCDFCHDMVQATKSTKITRVPHILMINLNRHKGSSNSSGNGNKRDDLVEFPLEDLDMGQYIDTEMQTGTNMIYDLFAVINHINGDSQSGHYISFAKHPLYQTWAKYDDEKVT